MFTKVPRKKLGKIGSKTNKVMDENTPTRMKFDIDIWNLNLKLKLNLNKTGPSLHSSAIKGQFQTEHKLWFSQLLYVIPFGVNTVAAI